MGVHEDNTNAMGVILQFDEWLMPSYYALCCIEHYELPSCLGFVDQ
jgi:hypothetical protein